MKKYSEEMNCSKEEYIRLNETVDNINRHLGHEVFTLESTEGYETECVDIYENGELNTNYAMFDDAIWYLEGIERGVLLKEEYSV